MDLKKIVTDLENNKKIKEVLLGCDISLDELLLKVLKENEEMRERINKNEKLLSEILNNIRTPW